MLDSFIRSRRVPNEQDLIDRARAWEAMASENGRSVPHRYTAATGGHGATARRRRAASSRAPVASTTYGTEDSGYGATLLTLISQRT